MWKFKSFTQKEQIGLEGRFIDIGNFKVQVRNVVAEGGFSCVYLARDVVHGSKQYALKHIICNDEESQELVMREISVMKTLKGHPNIVTLLADAIFDMGRTKEALLLMECCEKSLVNVLDSRGIGFFEEKQALTIFRDICNAVFGMHCQTPPIAHRDLKAENLLLGCDGSWKLCDFGSTSTNHKRFEKPEEMGIEEDNIRKYTTPAYRAPEMWDLFRRELINEKVDIWALGCLFYRICYLKLAFDGESKLQVLNGNYRIPDLPKYNKLLTDLIRDMLQSSPDGRPDITQVWFRVNDLLPESMQKSLPDRPPEMPEPKTDVFAGIPKPSNKSSPMPGRSPLPVPSSNVHQVLLSTSNSPGPTENAGPLGAFWTSHHAKDSEARVEKNRPKYNGDDHKSPANEIVSPDRHPAAQVTPHIQKNALGRSINRPTDLPNKDLNLFPDHLNSSPGGLRESKPEIRPTFQNDAFNAFVADFDVNKQSPSNTNQKQDTEKTLEAEVEKLRKQLANVSAKKADMTSKYENLVAICRSQRQEIQELKHALAARTPSPSRDSSRNLASPGNQSSPTPSSVKIEGTVLELQQAFFQGTSPSSDSKEWQAFSEDSKPTPLQTNSAPRSVRIKSSQLSNQASQPTPVANSWGFETESFKVVSASSSKITTPSDGEMNNSQRFGVSKSTETKSKFETQPSGWAGF